MNVQEPGAQLRLAGQDDPLPLRTSLEAARDHLRDEDERARREVGPSPRRLLVSGILILFGGLVFFVLLPYIGVYLPPIIPVTAFIAILLGAIFAGASERELMADDEPTSEPPEDEGRPVLCCPGPRPLGTAERLRRARSGGRFGLTDGR